MFFNYDPMAFQIMTVYRLKHTDGFYRVNKRPFAAISYRIKGSGSFKFGDTAFTVRGGDVTFFPANTDYEALYDGSEVIVLHLASCSYSSPENISLHNPEYIYRLFEQLMERWIKQHNMNISKADVFTILARLEEDQSKTLGDDLQSCNIFLRENFTSPSLRVGDICRAGHMSESSLYRHFYEYHGMSPKQYLLTMRLGYSIELLLSGEMTVEEIAHASGFNDAKYFSRAFKKHYGKPPTEYLDAEAKRNK